MGKEPMFHLKRLPYLQEAMEDLKPESPVVYVSVKKLQCIGPTTGIMLSTEYQTYREIYLRRIDLAISAQMKAAEFLWVSSNHRIILQAHSMANMVLAHNVAKHHNVLTGKPQ